MTEERPPDFASGESRAEEKAPAGPSIVTDEKLATLLPPLAPGETEILRENVARNGVDPIVVWRRKNEDTDEEELVVVDGHHRYRMALELEIECPVRELEFADLAQAAWYVAQNQLGRRNLTTAQKAAVTLALLPIETDAAKERQRASGGDRRSREGGRGAVPPKFVGPLPRSEPVVDGGEVREARSATGARKSSRDGEALVRAARTAGVSPETVRKCGWIAKHDAVLWEEVQASRVSIDKAHAIVDALKGLPPAVAGAVDSCLDAERHPTRRDPEQLERLRDLSEEDALWCVRMIAGQDVPPNTRPPSDVTGAEKVVKAVRRKERLEEPLRRLGESAAVKASSPGTSGTSREASGGRR